MLTGTLGIHVAEIVWIPDLSNHLGSRLSYCSGSTKLFAGSCHRPNKQGYNHAWPVVCEIIILTTSIFYLGGPRLTSLSPSMLAPNDAWCKLELGTH